MHGHNSSDELAGLMVAACEQSSIGSRKFSEKDYALLPPFNWDIKDYQECAALHLVDRAITILHVVSVLDNNSLVYRAKALFPSPRSILESPDYHDRDAFSVTFRDAGGGIWKSDCDSQLESTIADIWSKTNQISDGDRGVDLYFLIRSKKKPCVGVLLLANGFTFQMIRDVAPGIPGDY